MTPETEAQIQKVRKFGQNFQQLSRLAGAFLVIVCLLALATIFAAPHPSNFKVGLGAYMFTGDHMTTPELKAWACVVVTTVFAFLLAIVLQLQRLFGRLAAGSIYTRENVRGLRRVGLLALALGVFQLLLPLFSQGLVDAGVIDRALVAFAEPTDRSIFLVGPASLSGFIMASLVLLASWIMDVGRQTADEADGMRRDADLVI